MAPIEAPSPSLSNMPPPNLKRPRQSNTTTGPITTATTTLQPRAKRRKPEEPVEREPIAGERDKAGRSMNFGMGMVKGREEEWGEPGDVQTKIDFKQLPLETLYKYLEHHDLLPRWDVSPWSEEPCTPPTMLYTIPPPPPTIPIVASPTRDSKSASPSQNPLDPPANGHNHSQERPEAGSVSHEGGTGDEPIEEDPIPAPPTTRSKTAPHRKQPTPPPPSPPAAEMKRGVITLSDVNVAREVLAEKANAHWVKGLGGGQNKEGETIVNFLYKMKVGHGRLLRVYNPNPAPFP